MITICVANQKGGVAKSSTADALAAYLSKAPNNARVLTVDLDSQCNLTASYGINPAEKHLSARDVIAGAVKAKDAIHKTERGDMLPSSPLMSLVDSLLTGQDKYLRLKTTFSSLAKDYDFIVIDTPPNMGSATINALFASDIVIVPAQADMYTVQGLNDLLNNIGAIKKHNKLLRIGGILLTRHNPRAKFSQFTADKMSEVAQAYGTYVLDSYIRECIAVKEAQGFCQNIFDYAPDSNAAFDYKKAFKEVFSKLTKEGNK